MSVYLANSVDSRNSNIPVSRRNGADDESANASAPRTQLKVSIKNLLDGTTIKTTEKTNQDGSKTITVETTDPQGNRTIETTEYAACTPTGTPASSVSPPPPVITMLTPTENTMMPPPPPEDSSNVSELEQGQDFNVSKSPDSVEKQFWNRRNKILVGIAVLTIIGIVIAIIVVATSSKSGSDSGPPAENPAENPAVEGFAHSWASENGVMIGDKYETVDGVNSLSLCAQQCLAKNAPTGFFRASQAGNEGDLCVCESTTKCLDPMIEIKGAQVFSKFPAPATCEQSFCETSPSDPMCANVSATPGTSPAPTALPPPLPTPPPIATPPPTPPPTPLAAPPPTPSPTVSQTAPTPPSGSLQAAVYYLQWYGATDEGENCEEPTPGMLVTCGEGGQIDIINSPDTAICDFAGTGVICTGEIGDEEDFWAFIYGCIGSTATSWTTKVVALPDASVQCSSGGAAGTSIFLGQGCPGADGDTNFNEVQCLPSDSFQTGQTSGINFCQTSSFCQDSTCTLSTPDVAAEIPESAISSSCLFAVTGGNPPPTPAPTPPPPTSANPEASVYQVQWVGVVFPEESCDEPTPGMRVFCGEGGEIEILDNTDTVECSYIGVNEVSCTVTFDDTILWALVYQCIGTTELSWTTNVEVVPDSSVQCSSDAITGSGLFLQQRCPDQDPDPNQVQCDPTDALETSDSGVNFCRTIVTCQGSSCVLGTPDLGASIPVSAITDSCLWSP